MKDHAGKPLDLGENHRRGITTRLMLLDEMLCQVEDWARGRERDGVLYHERNDLQPAQREVLLREAASMRALLTRAAQRLRLTAAPQSAAADVWGRCAAFRQTIMELEGRQLRCYGQASPQVERYMDGLSRELLEGLDALVQALSAEVNRPS